MFDKSFVWIDVFSPVVITQPAYGLTGDDDTAEVSSPDRQRAQLGRHVGWIDDLRAIRRGSIHEKAISPALGLDLLYYNGSLNVLLSALGLIA
jgi:hypothetical protein